MAGGGDARRSRLSDEDDEPVLTMLGVHKTYGEGQGEVVALDGVDIDVRAGEMMGVVGRSGSGKTTLLNLAAGWDRPDRPPSSVRAAPTLSGPRSRSCRSTSA